MRTLLVPVATAGLALLLAAGVAAAASPAPTAPAAEPPAPVATPTPTAGPIAAILGLTDAEVMALRQQGLSLAQVAEQQKVDPQVLVDALAAQWSARIDARVTAGALTAEQAAELRDDVAVRAKAMVYQSAPGGMRGAAVGAGPGVAGQARGRGAGNGGPGMGGAGRGGAMRGAGGGGTCPMTAPSS